MLYIRAQQLDDMKRGRDSEFAASTARFYRENFPMFLQRMDADALSRYTLDALRVARSFGISNHDALTQYVALAIFAGPEFFKNPAITAFMEHPDVSPDEALRDLIERVIRKLQPATFPKRRQAAD